MCRRIGSVLRVSYTGGYLCRVSLRCPHNIFAQCAYCNLLCFLMAPSLILILSISRALFPGSKAGKSSRNKVQCHDMLCNCLYVFYAHNEQDQFLLPRKGRSNLILDCVLIENSSSRTCLNIAQCTIGIGLLFYILVLSVSGAVFFCTIL